MSDFNDIFRNALDGYEAPFDANAWDKLSSKLSPLEDAFRTSVNNYEAPYNPKAWSAIKNQIGSSSNLYRWLVGSAASLGLVLGAVALVTAEDEMLVERVSQNTIENATPIVFELEKPTTTNLAERIENLDITPENELLAVSTNPLQVGSSGQPDPIQTNPLLNPTITEEKLDSNSPNGSLLTPPADLVEQNESGSDLKYNADFTCSLSEFCAGETVLFNPKVLKSGLTYTWHFGDGTSSSTPAPSHTYNASSNYTVTLSLRDEKTNKLLASSTQTVVVNKLPDANFTHEMTNEIIPTVDFLTSAEENTNSIWLVNGKIASDKNQFEYTFKEKGNYTIELITKSEEGCQNKSQKQINIEEDYNLLAPTAFTPDGNNRNETFIPLALELMNCEFTMMVYNQAGKLVYQTVNVNSPWNGSDMTDHSLAPNGAYIWVVTLKNGNGIMENYKGQVFLTR